MAQRYPKIVFTEEVMREGMQIESASIPTEDKVELLNALSETGLKNIVVGVPVRVGRGGAEQIIEYELTGDEQAALEASANAVRELCTTVDRLMT